MKNYDLPLEELPFDLTDELGEIAFAELLCPGVYQVGAKSPTKTDGILRSLPCTAPYTMWKYAPLQGAVKWGHLVGDGPV